MLKEDVIEKLLSFWVFGVIFVCKKDGSFCFCVDYRRFNDVMIKDVYLLLRIDEILDYFLGVCWFLILDFFFGYW